MHRELREMTSDDDPFNLRFVKNTGPAERVRLLKALTQVNN
jgi:hypothetical protein